MTPIAWPRAATQTQTQTQTQTLTPTQTQAQTQTPTPTHTLTLGLTQTQTPTRRSERIGLSNGQFAHHALQLCPTEPSPTTDIAQRSSPRRKIAAQASQSGSNKAVQQLQAAPPNAAVHPPAQAARLADSPDGEVELQLRRADSPDGEIVSSLF